MWKYSILGGVLLEKLGEGKTKIYDFPCAIYDLTKNLKPYLRPDP